MRKDYIRRLITGVRKQIGYFNPKKQEWEIDYGITDRPIPDYFLKFTPIDNGI